jgi:bile acid:Na+ symporter, BASS family
LETLQLVMKWLILVFVVSSMATLGLSLRFKEIVKPLRQPLLVIMILIVNFVVSPALAYLLTWLFPVNTSYETGLLLLSAAAGAPFLPKLVELAGCQVALSVSILILQIVGSIVLMPFTLPLLVPGLSADALSIAYPLILQLLLPLILGLGFHRMYPQFSERLLPFLKRITGISALAAIVLLLITNLEGILNTLGSGAGVLALGFVALTMMVGFVGDMASGSSSIVQALAGGQRNIAAALVVAASNHLDKLVMVMLVMTTFIGLIPLVGLAIYWKKTTLNQTPSITVSKGASS